MSICHSLCINYRYIWSCAGFQQNFESWAHEGFWIRPISDKWFICWSTIFQHRITCAFAILQLMRNFRAWNLGWIEYLCNFFSSNSDFWSNNARNLQIPEKYFPLSNTNNLYRYIFHTFRKLKLPLNYFTQAICQFKKQ